MAFDKSLDMELFGETVEFETTQIRVSVFSYNEGTPKLQIGRKNLNPNNGDWTFSKLGRMTKDEVVKVLPLMEKALEKL